MIENKITLADYIIEENKINILGRCTRAVVPNMKTNDFGDGIVKHESSPRASTFSGDGPYDTYYIRCYNEKWSIEISDFKKGLDQLPHDQGLFYLLIKAIDFTTEIEEIINQDDKKFIIVLRK